MKRNMKWIFIGVGAFILAVAIAALIFLYIARKNVRDKGGMENPFRTDEITTSVGEDNTNNTSNK